MAITIIELERRVTGVEHSFRLIQEQLDRSDALFDNFRGYVNNCFDEVFQRLDNHGQRFDRIETHMVTHSDVAAMELRLKDFICNTFQKPRS